mmetsp:Transcript_20048/g.57440  ORF Transcript_20048/g.57440 Transcript_20048/m.57440 type:complete len:191 (-) Transcript_20048:549-1121(-)
MSPFPTLLMSCRKRHCRLGGCSGDAAAWVDSLPMSESTDSDGLDGRCYGTSSSAIGPMYNVWGSEDVASDFDIDDSVWGGDGVDSDDDIDDFVLDDLHHERSGVAYEMTEAVYKVWGPQVGSIDDDDDDGSDLDDDFGDARLGVSDEVPEPLHGVSGGGIGDRGHDLDRKEPDRLHLKASDTAIHHICKA